MAYFVQNNVRNEVVSFLPAGDFSRDSIGFIREKLTIHLARLA